jgi:hypothetical protein
MFRLAWIPAFAGMTIFQTPLASSGSLKAELVR